MLHFRGGRAGISKEAYPELDPAFYDDVAKAYGDELRSLYDAGCRYVQMDDTNMAYLCDEKMREAARQRGDDPNELPHRYAGSSTRWWRTSRRHDAGHAPVPRQLQEHACGGRQLRAGGRGAAVGDEPRRLLPGVRRRPLGRLPPAALPEAKGKIVVLGLVTTKFGQLESKDALKRRIDEAAKYAPLDQLCLSPQCGFSSTVHGNNIAVEDQRNKLRLVVETAQEVWGSLGPYSITR
jgi:5-methyltetrahydropteroyltriglutamate--homocysteine methyltransferase